MSKVGIFCPSMRFAVYDRYFSEILIRGYGMDLVQFLLKSVLTDS